MGRITLYFRGKSRQRRTPKQLLFFIKMASLMKCARMATHATRQVLRVSQTKAKFPSQSLRQFSFSRALLSDRKFTEGHEWISMDGDVGTVGLSAHAQDSLGDIVFVELPEIDAEYEQNDDCGVVESVKAVSEIFCPVTGKITARNETVVEDPSIINKSYDDKGWLFKIELTDKAQLDGLMSEDQYKEFLDSQ